MRDVDDGKGRCDLLPLHEVAELICYKYCKTECALFFIDDFIRIGNWSSLNRALVEFIQERGWDAATAMLEVSIHFSDGCAKYGERNWEKGIPVHCYIDSAIRHYLKWVRGDDDEPHDRAFVWNILCTLWTLRNHPECNDIWEKTTETVEE